MFNFNPSSDIMKRYNLGAQIGNSINSIAPGENGNGPSGGGMIPMMPHEMMPQQPPPIIDSGPSMPPPQTQLPMGQGPQGPQMPSMQRGNPGRSMGMGRPQPQGQGGNASGSPLWKRYMQMMAQQSGRGMNTGMGM